MHDSRTLYDDNSWILQICERFEPDSRLIENEKDMKYE